MTMMTQIQKERERRNSRRLSQKKKRNLNHSRQICWIWEEAVYQKLSKIMMSLKMKKTLKRRSLSKDRSKLALRS